MKPRRLPDGSLTTSRMPALTANRSAFVAANVGVSAVIPRTTTVGPSATRGFVGLTTADNPFELEPPDQGLAANNGLILEATNLSLAVYDAASSNLIAGPVDLPTFFGDSYVFSDPQVFFDPTMYTASNTTAASKGRWIVTVLSEDASGNQYIDVAVSQTSDPTGIYYTYKVHAFSDDVTLHGYSCGGVDCLPDYPKAGFDANGFYISVNLFNSNEDFIGAATYILPKAKLRDQLSFNYARIVYDDGTAGSFLVQPSIPAPGQAYVTTAGGTELLMEARKLWDGVSNKIRVWAISNTSTLIADNTCSVPGQAGTICAIKATYVDVATPSSPGTATTPTAGYYAGYSVAALQPNNPGPNLGVWTALDGGYGGFQATAQWAYGKIFGILTTTNANETGNLLSWYAIKPTVSTTGAVTATLANKGTIVPPAGYFIQFGSMGLKKTGAGVIGFSISNPNFYVPGNYPSTGYIKFTGTATSGNLIITGQGTAANDGFSAGPAYGYVGRWGDYGAAVIDPMTAAATLPVYFTGNEMIANPFTKYGGYVTNWSTYITRIQ